MKNTACFLFTGLLFIASCTKSVIEPVTPPVTDNGPWGGTYKLVSTSNFQSDTLDATPYGGNSIRYTLDTFSASGMNVKLVATKANLTLEQLGYQVNRINVIKDYYASTGARQQNRYTSSYFEAGDNFMSNYTITADSVYLSNPIPFAKVSNGRFNANNKVKFTYSGNTLTFYNDLYESKVVNITGQNYRVGNRSTTVAVYQKQ
jgi:hypothetical protein